LGERGRQESLKKKTTAGKVGISKGQDQNKVKKRKKRANNIEDIGGGKIEKGG